MYDSDSFICLRRSSKVLVHEFFSLNNYQIHYDTVDTYVMQVAEDISEYVHMLITLSWESALAELNPTILLVLLAVTLDSHIVYDSLVMLEITEAVKASNFANINANLSQFC